MIPSIYIGTSGWNYNHWVGKFYPKKLDQSKWFGFYSKHFETVEINNTFYQLPSEETFKSWEEKGPPSFIYSIKANRYITHMKNLKDPKEPLTNLYERYEILGKKAGPILFQLPPYWSLNIQRLESFIDILQEKRPDYLYSIEFRNNTWYEDKVYKLLRDNNIALCIHDHEDGPSPMIVTANFIYRRFHGTSGSYSGRYGKKNLREIAQFLKEKELKAYCYFNNDYEAHAIEDASTLKQLLS